MYESEEPEIVYLCNVLINNITVYDEKVLD